MSAAEDMRENSYSWEMERALLGGLILDPTQIPDVAETIRPGDFHRPQHAAMFGLIHRMHSAGAGIDIATVLEEITRLACAEEMGGFAYAANLPNACPTVENIPDYATRLRELGTRRAMEMEFRRGIEAIRAGADLREVIANAGAALSEASEASAGKEAPRFVMIGETAREVIAEVHAAADDRAPKVSRVMIPTGYPLLDKRLIGFEPGDLVIIGGRSGMGKSAFVGNLALNMGRAGYGVAILSLEMMRKANVRRMLCADGRASSSQLRAGRLDLENYRRLVAATERVDGLPIAIDDGKGAGVTDLRARLRRLTMPKGQRVSVVAVDYLQLLRPGRRAGNREAEVSGIARDLKELAAELGVVILALSQIARGVEGRADKRPMMSDLRESGEIEQAADAVILLYRDDYYHSDSPQRGVCEIIVAKLREGSTGTVPLAWHGDYQLFESLDSPGWAPAPVPAPAYGKKTKSTPKGSAAPPPSDPDDPGPMF